MQFVCLFTGKKSQHKGGRMNLLDVILLILLLAGAVSGFTKGLFVELASVVSLVLGIWAGIDLSPVVQGWLSKLLSWSPGNLKLLAFILIFLVVTIIVHLVANVFEKTIRAFALGILSRFAGALFGALKAAFFLSILLLLISNIEHYTTTLIPETSKRESKLYRPIENFALHILPFLKSYQKTPVTDKEKPVTT
jgi:membrane protein required for colicin V production